jgi:hypothetical protein
MHFILKTFFNFALSFFIFDLFTFVQNHPERSRTDGICILHYRLSLSLFMLYIFTNDIDALSSTDSFATIAHRFY